MTLKSRCTFFRSTTCMKIAISLTFSEIVVNTLSSKMKNTQVETVTSDTQATSFGIRLGTFGSSCICEDGLYQWLFVSHQYPLILSQLERVTRRLMCHI